MAHYSHLSCALVIGLAATSLAGAVRTLIDLQPQRKIEEFDAKDVEGKSIHATLINLNPNVNSWYILKLQLLPQKTEKTFHLENSDPGLFSISLAKSELLSLTVAEGQKTTACQISIDQLTSLMATATKDNDSYAPICDGRMYLRIAITGRLSSKEAVAGFLRKHIWGGDAITSLVKQTLYQDTYMLESDTSNVTSQKLQTVALDTAPPEGQVDADSQGKLIKAVELGIPLKNTSGGSLVAGQWYQAENDPSVYLSAIEPGIIDKKILASYPERVGKLDEVEKKALSYLVAFDMTAFNVGFAIGTESPSIEWSPRVASEFIKSGAGPDGVADISPIVGTGRIRPNIVSLVAATFTGGFKRNHGAFRHGELAQKNNGSHYGFIESGVILSSLQPGLATALIDLKGTISLRTWTEGDNEKILPSIAHARQNGVAIIEDIDSSNGLSLPGALVDKWGPGNWSGSIDSKERALRAGICTTSKNGRQYLIYGYFSTATPSAMARVFQAYRCDYGFHLDMNALEHTYLATYSVRNSKLQIHNLIEGMGVLDRRVDDDVSPRFIGISDNRDFFYLIRKQEEKAVTEQVPDPSPSMTSPQPPSDGLFEAPPSDLQEVPIDPTNLPSQKTENLLPASKMEKVNQ